jgi:hypothetical protein
MVKGAKPEEVIAKLREGAATSSPVPLTKPTTGSSQAWIDTIFAL